ncbi:GntR family transcriptional regulator [Paenibacillus sp. ACRRX]|uniref:GntR family transcriptional regulator n=1 Tax=unclassified Paenibacillus TaxID=185978 RepID=UPI001EF63FA9|nr:MULTISPECIES: GntR family transcriptional regulator [unclassified Paenibacillus]MCG7407227.1 GntR family transcriptional regulator [Paenibacillus sp. ACRRX]MDK8180446.1 GntR family transcriptional regulator [Paenibacillus sp. UMB4589-SE434]
MTKRHTDSLYVKVKEQILKHIHSGVYPVGSKIPTEVEMCRMYKVSRTTIRTALQDLERDRLLERTQGRGTFVKKHELQMKPTRSFADDVLAYGKRPSSKVVKTAVVPATAPLDELLGIPLNSAVHQVLRVRYADDEPVLYEQCHIPWNHAPGLASELTDGSLYELLQCKYNLHVRTSTEKLKPVLADNTASRLLGIEEGTPCLQVVTLSYLDDEVPLEYTYGIFRGDVSYYVIERTF